MVRLPPCSGNKDKQRWWCGIFQDVSNSIWIIIGQINPQKDNAILMWWKQCIWNGSHDRWHMGSHVWFRSQQETTLGTKNVKKKKVPKNAPKMAQIGHVPTGCLVERMGWICLFLRSCIMMTTAADNKEQKWLTMMLMMIRDDQRWSASW